VADAVHAILIVGPTGSGKTPLGNLLASDGLLGAVCHHFDFGDRLRALAATECPKPPFTPEEVAFVRDILASGALLEDNDFALASKLFSAFLADRRPQQDEIIVLNGLPRHESQAAAFDELASVRAVVYLSCPAHVVFERIRADAAGDRAGRADDDMAAVERKLAVFAQRTAPLLEHYSSHGVPVVVLEVSPATTAAQMRDRLVKEVRLG